MELIPYMITTTNGQKFSLNDPMDATHNRWLGGTAITSTPSTGSQTLRI
uniref:Phage tail protein n=1 Tax=Heterorhabditis bacteriophora TaxID=37862 RepID=A0A1I7X3M2_HETBA